MVLTGFDEGAMAYDIQRAHSADIFFMRMRAWFWGVSLSIVCFLAGNLLGATGLDIFGGAWQSMVDTWEWI